ncbi:MAG: hypothetical protein ABJD97_20955, partial [Betaproteobacteria bacterium]
MQTASLTPAADRRPQDGPLLLAMNPGLAVAPAMVDTFSFAANDHEPLPMLWRALAQRLSAVLLALPAPDAARSLDAAARRLATLVERDPDLAIFQLVRSEQAQATPYGVVRS